jgi:hypothetical protein
MPKSTYGTRGHFVKAKEERAVAKEELEGILCDPRQWQKAAQVSYPAECFFLISRVSLQRQLLFLKRDVVEL